MSDYEDLPLFEPTAEELRDEGIAKVTESTAPFTQRVLERVAQIPVGEEFTGEDIRLMCQREGITPAHHNAWGAAIMHCCRRGLLEKTGEYRKMKAPQSHARATPVYVTTLPKESA